MGVLEEMAREAGRLRRGVVLEGRAGAGYWPVRHRDRAAANAGWALGGDPAGAREGGDYQGGG